MAGNLFSVTFPLCLVEKLDIKSNMLNDSIVLTITNALFRNTILKTLDLSYSIGGDGIMIASWGFLFNLLQGSNSALENLTLSFKYITNKVVDALTNVLVINNQQQVKGSCPRCWEGYCWCRLEGFLHCQMQSQFSIGKAGSKWQYHHRTNHAFFCRGVDPQQKDERICTWFHH